MSTLAEAEAAQEISPEAARALFDRACREELSVSGSEFKRLYEAQELPADWSSEAVSRLEFLLPFAR